MPHRALMYQFYDIHHATLAPARFAAGVAQAAFQNPYSPVSYTHAGRAMAAAAELFERTTRRFEKPEFGLDCTVIDGKDVEVTEEVTLKTPFCNLLHFKRATRRNDPKVLIVAPVSGHHATLLRGTVKALLPHHDVYITDWIDARHVPLLHGRFGLAEYIDYVIDFINHLGPKTNVIAVCQPAVPVLAAVSVMAANNMPNQPDAMVLMGGPIDTRAADTAVTEFAANRPIGWFERNVITYVPAYYPGAFRRVYPGFLQLSGFMAMNIDRHIGAHMKMFNHLVIGDGESAEAHRRFYDEYLSVMDMPAEFYLETVQYVFKEQALARGTLPYRDQIVDPSRITHTALMTVEGELDDISAVGQTTAAHKLCSGIPANKKRMHVQANVGHYGIFNGRRWREQIMPRVRDFLREQRPDAYAKAPVFDDAAEEQPALKAAE